MEELTRGSELVRSARTQHERIGKTFACKAAIKAGQHLSQEEMAELFDALFASRAALARRPWPPHGGPPHDRGAGSEIRPVTPHVLAIVGPTASGKSELAVAVARRLDGEVVSMDSRQVYRGMDVGTAKLPAVERGGIAHHGLDLMDPDRSYSAGAFAREAQGWIAAIRDRGRVPILVGGTGFFLRALTQPIFGEARPRPGPDAALCEAGWLRGPVPNWRAGLGCWIPPALRSRRRGDPSASHARSRSRSSPGVRCPGGIGTRPPSRERCLRWWCWWSFRGRSSIGALTTVWRACSTEAWWRKCGDCSQRGTDHTIPE